MAILLEPVDRGLRNRVDPVVIDRGGLRAAANARYRKGDPTIWQAEGRRKIAGMTGPTQAGQVAGIGWDGDTQVGDQSAAESKAQVTSKGILAGFLDSRAARDGTDDPGWADASRTQLPLPSNQFAWPLLNPPLDVPVRIVDLGPRDLQVIAHEGRNILLSGGSAGIVMRKTLKTSATIAANTTVAKNHVHLAPFGMPAVPVTLAPTIIQESTGGTAFAKGFYDIWWTWVSRVDDEIIEGTGTVLSPDPFTFYGQTRVTATNITGFQVWLDANKFIRAIPPFATHVYLYRSLVYESDRVIAGATESTRRAFPAGFRDPIFSGAGNQLITDILASRVADATYESGYKVRLGIFVRDDAAVSAGGLVFPTVSITNRDLTPRNGAPPRATTGDSFRGSVVVNDLDAPGSISYTPEGEPYTFPGAYKMWFDTAARDEVVKISTFGNILGIYMKRAIFRVNWLPMSDDIIGTQARELVASGLGVDGVRCVCDFTVPGLGPLQAFVHRTGVYATDLTPDGVIPLTDHADWNDIAGGADFEHASIINNSDEQRLELWIKGKGWFIHYDKAHWFEGEPAITGPMYRNPSVKWAVPIVTLTGAHRTILGSDPNFVYYDNVGYADDTSPTPLLIEIDTRDIYPAGIGKEARSIFMLAHIRSSGAAAGNWHLELVGGRRFQAERTLISKQYSLLGRVLLQEVLQEEFEHCHLRFVGTSVGVPVGLDLLGLNVEGLDDAS